MPTEVPNSHSASSSKVSPKSSKCFSASDKCNGENVKEETESISQPLSEGEKENKKVKMWTC